MRTLLASIVVLFAAGMVWAGQGDPIQIQSDETTTKESNGQELELTASGISVEVEFYEISELRVRGRVSRIGGSPSGTFTILWKNRNQEEEIHIDPNHQDRQFGLEGGDTDKRSSGHLK